MKLFEIKKPSTNLNEGANTKVILIDFQPEYENAVGYGAALSNVTEYLNKNKPSNVLIFYNGPELGFEQTPDSILQHYIGYGLDGEEGDSFTFRDKSYAFFRSWMDEGIDVNTIIKVIRNMVIQRKYDSRDIEEDEMRSIVGEDEYENYSDIIESDPLSIPDIALDELKSYSGALMGGGGRDECLREVQILMNAFNIKYKMVDTWIY